MDILGGTRALPPLAMATAAIAEAALPASVGDGCRRCIGNGGGCCGIDHPFGAKWFPPSEPRDCAGERWAANGTGPADPGAPPSKSKKLGTSPAAPPSGEGQSIIGVPCPPRRCERLEGLGAAQEPTAIWPGGIGEASKLQSLARPKRPPLAPPTVDVPSKANIDAAVAPLLEEPPPHFCGEMSREAANGNLC